MVSGKRDWLANGVLFALGPRGRSVGHPGPPARARRGLRLEASYRSALVGIAVHSAQSVVLFGIVLSLVLKG